MDLDEVIAIALPMLKHLDRPIVTMTEQDEEGKETTLQTYGKNGLLVKTLAGPPDRYVYLSRGGEILVGTTIHLNENHWSLLLTGARGKDRDDLITANELAEAIGKAVAQQQKSATRKLRVLENQYGKLNALKKEI
jgi:hypothetical protein